MEKRYAALRLIGTINQVLGVFIAVLTVLSVIAILAASFLGGVAIDTLGFVFGNEPGMLILFNNLLGGLLTSAIVMLAGGMLAIIVYAAGEFIFLLLAFEENTRSTHILLQRQLSLRAPAASQEVVALEPEHMPESTPEIPLESVPETAEGVFVRSVPEDEAEASPPVSAESGATS